MSIFSVLSISESALDHHRLRLETIAMNMANVDTVFSPGGEGFRPLEVIAQQGMGRFAPLSSEVVERDSGPVRHYRPEHPYADANGFTSGPDIDRVDEMTSLVASRRLYEANIRVINAAKAMFRSALEIGA